MTPRATADREHSRVIVHFSCGAASAVTAKLALAAYPNVEIVNAYIKREDEDNRRFLADCEKWLGRTITVLRDTKYDADPDEVWRRERFMVSQHGAPCSRALKRKLLDGFRVAGDTIAIGFTAEEEDRAADFREHFPTIHLVTPLIEHGLRKADCLAMIERAGMVLPLMYRQGFENANCPGCPKGGMGYWNKIRIVRPERFAEVMAIQEDIGDGAYFFRNRKTGERYGLKDLDPKAGRHNEPAPSCGFFCEQAEVAYA